MMVPMICSVIAPLLVSACAGAAKCTGSCRSTCAESSRAGSSGFSLLQTSAFGSIAPPDDMRHQAHADGGFDGSSMASGRSLAQIQSHDQSPPVSEPSAVIDATSSATSVVAAAAAAKATDIGNRLDEAAIKLTAPVQATPADKSNAVVAEELRDPRMPVMVQIKLDAGLQVLQQAVDSSLTKFLRALGDELASVAKVSRERLNILDIRSQSATLSLVELEALETIHAVALLAAVADSNATTMVDLEVIPGKDQDETEPTPIEVFHVFQENLATKGSKLRTGALAGVLNGASISVLGKEYVHDNGSVCAHPTLYLGGSLFGIVMALWTFDFGSL